MRKMITYITIPFKWLWEKFCTVIWAVLDFVILSSAGIAVLSLVLIIGGCYGIGVLVDVNTRWQIDPANTYEGNFFTLKVDEACNVFAEELDSGEKFVLNTMQRIRVNNDLKELHRLRMSIVPNRVYWFRYIKENGSEDPTIIQAELLDHVPPRPPKLINKGPKYNAFEKENKDEQENSEEVKQEQEAGK